jgi:hypothetical protein
LYVAEEGGEALQVPLYLLASLKVQEYPPLQELQVVQAQAVRVHE